MLAEPGRVTDTPPANGAGTRSVGAGVAVTVNESGTGVEVAL